MRTRTLIRWTARDGGAALLSALLAPASHCATILSHTRSLASNATVSLGAQTVSDPMSASTNAAGQYTESLESFAQIQTNTASGESYQSSAFDSDSMSLDTTAFAGLSLDAGASGSGSASTSFVLVFSVGATEGWRVDAAATNSGVPIAGDVSLRLTRGSVVIFEVDTALGAFSLHRAFALAPGTYRLEAQCDASLQGAAGSGIANGSATLSATMDRTPVATCAGDANGDGSVDFTDLDIVLSDYGMSGPAGSLLGDLDSSGAVDFVDLNIVLSSYGTTC